MINFLVKNILGDKSKNIIKDEKINNIKVRFQKVIDFIQRFKKISR